MGSQPWVSDPGTQGLQNPTSLKDKGALRGWEEDPSLLLDSPCVSAERTPSIIVTWETCQKHTEPGPFEEFGNSVWGGTWGSPF